MNIGKRLVQERKRLGLKQTAFAKQIGVSLSSQKRYESGEREPDTSYLKRAISMGVDVSYILTNIRREQDHNKQLGIDEFHSIIVAGCFAKLHGLTKDDLSAVIQSVDAVMENDLNGNSLPDDNVILNEDMFLIAISELLNKKSQAKEYIKGLHEIDYLMLRDILENLEIVQQRNKLVLSPHKKARAVTMLYRNFKSSGNVDYDSIEDILAIAGDVPE